MDPTTLQQLQEMVEATVRRLLDERFGPAKTKPVDPSKSLLSLTEAARVLGIDKKTTLRDLIAAGQITTVQGTRGVRIPRAEIEQMLVTGIPKPGMRTRRSRKPTKTPPPKDVAAQILGISV